jgi:hypothetical protein
MRMANEERFYNPTRMPSAKRVASPGFKQWKLRQGNRVMTCELVDHGGAGAGVNVQLREDGELLVSRRCVTADAARYIVQSFKNDHLRTGWVESTSEDAIDS